MKKSPKPQTPQQSLEAAYWLHWCGDDRYARDMLIRIADFVINRKATNEPQTSYSKQTTPQKGTEEDYDDFLVR